MSGQASAAEVTARRGTRRSTASWASMPSRSARALARVSTRSRPLVEVADLHTRRRRCASGRQRRPCALEVDDDDVTATVNGESTTHFHEVEVESGPSSDPKLIRHIVKRLRKAGADPGDSMPKIVRSATADAGTRSARDEGNHHEGASRRAGSGLDRARGRTADQSRSLRAPRRRLGSRTQCPRRHPPTAFRSADVSADPRRFLERGVARRIAWLGEQLGRVRDADVLLARLTVIVEDVPGEDRAAADAVLLDRLRQMRDRDRAQLLDTLNSKRYAVLLDCLVTAARAPVNG